MRWLFFLAILLALIAHLVSQIPIAEATPRHKTRLKGINQIIQPSTANFQLNLTLEYKKKLFDYAPLVGKTIYFYLGEPAEKTARKLLGTALTNKDGHVTFTDYTPPLGVLVKVTAEFQGDLDFAPSDHLIKLKRLNVFPSVEILSLQVNNRQVKIAWQGKDPDGKVQAYRYQLDKSLKYDKWTEWNQDTSHIYHDLKPGKYTFHVQAKDDFGGLSEYAIQKFQVEEKIIQLFVTDTQGNLPPFRVTVNTPLTLQSFLEENSIRKPLSPTWHCYQGKIENSVYLCSVAGIEDLLVVEDAESGKITFFKIKVEVE